MTKKEMSALEKQLLRALDTNRIEGGLTEVERVRALSLARALVDDCIQMRGVIASHIENAESN